MASEYSCAYRDGWCAHLAGLATDDNPYHEAKQAYSFSQWLSGWCDRFSTLKHGGDLSLDDLY